MTSYNEVMQEISDGYPVLVVGGPHAFVYDGYDEQGSFTPTGGWGGENDGYFDINIVPLMFQALPSIVEHSGTTSQFVFAHPNDGKAVPLRI